MKKTPILLVLFSLSAVAASGLKMGWNSTNEPLESDYPVLRWNICQDLVNENDTGVILERWECESKETTQFNVVKLFKAKNPYRDKNEVTQMILEIEVPSEKLKCEAKLIRRYETMKVDTKGQVKKVRGGWDVAEFNGCYSEQSSINKQLEQWNENPEKSKLKAESIEFDSIPKAIQNKIWDYDLPYVLADGYYSYTEKEGNPAYFAVMDSKGKVIGYMEEAELDYTEGDNEFHTVIYNNIGQAVVGPHNNDW